MIRNLCAVGVKCENCSSDREKCPAFFREFDNDRGDILVYMDGKQTRKDKNDHMDKTDYR